jgi:hypothetical protein
VNSNVAIFDEQVKPVEHDPHDFESVGSILRRLRRQCESEMTNEFCPHLSLRLDLCLALEQCAEESRP